MSDKILLVDDEKEFARVLAQRLEVRGHRVTTAGSGPEALEKAREESFDAVLLDLAMPVMDGIETLKRLREGNPKLQVILLTGHGTVEKGVEAIRLGALDFLEKPADIQLLLDKVNEAKARKTVLGEQETADAIAEILKTKPW